MLIKPNRTVWRIIDRHSYQESRHVVVLGSNYTSTTPVHQISHFTHYTGYMSRVQQGKSFRDNYASLLQVITAIICPPCSGCFISDKWHNCYVMNVLRLAHVAFCSTYTYIYYKIELSTYSLYTTCFATISVWNI